MCMRATCDRYTYKFEQNRRTFKISFWFAPVRMRANTAGSPLVKNRKSSWIQTAHGTCKTMNPWAETQQNIIQVSRIVCFMAVHQRFAGDPTLLVQVLAAHITSPTCIENCADRKHAQKRIVKHVDLLLDLRALWPKLTFCQSTMTEREKQKRQDRESEREHENFLRKQRESDQDDDCM